MMKSKKMIHTKGNTYRQLFVIGVSLSLLCNLIHSESWSDDNENFEVRDSSRVGQLYVEIRDFWTQKRELESNQLMWISWDLENEADSILFKEAKKRVSENIKNKKISFKIEMPYGKYKIRIENEYIFYKMYDLEIGRRGDILLIAPSEYKPDLIIKTVPESAAIFIDTMKQEKPTNCTLQIPIGEHKIRLELEGHVPVDRTYFVSYDKENLLQDTLIEKKFVVTVYDSTTNRPLVGAGVTFGDSSIFTDDDGKALFTRRSFPNKLLVEATDYHTKRRYYSTDLDEEIVEDTVYLSTISLKTFMVTVKDSITKRPITEANVTFGDSSKTTGSDGKVEFINPDFSDSLYVEAEGYKPKSKFYPAEVEEDVIYLSPIPPKIFVVTVQDSMTRELIAGARVTFGASRGTTNKDGKALLTTPIFPNTLIVNARGYVTWRRYLTTEVKEVSVLLSPERIKEPSPWKVLAAKVAVSVGWLSIHGLIGYLLTRL